MTQRQPPIRSKTYRDGSRGQPCTLRIVGVCTGGGEDTVFAHIRDSHTGKSVKASDLSGCDACAACHDAFDGRTGSAFQAEEWSSYAAEWCFYALRGLQETMERRLRQGLLSMPADVK